MAKIILFNKFINSNTPLALALIRSIETHKRAELPHHHEILDEEFLKLSTRRSQNGNFLFGYFKEPVEWFPLNHFKSEFFDWIWIDIEKFYDNPLNYVQDGWWNEMDKEDFLIFIKHKDEILQHFDRIKSA